MIALVLALMEHQPHAEQVRNCLERAGHSVELVDTFARAKFLLRDQPCDLILSDVHLQNGGNVFDFLKWVKSDPQLGAIPFVMLSLQPTEPAKYLSEGVRLAARHLGAAKYISMDKFDDSILTKELSEFLTPTDRPKSKSTPHAKKNGD